MKKFLVLFVCFLSIFSIPLFAETIYWEETFDYNTGEWSLEQNWTIADGKLELYWYPTVSPYDLSAISPLISLPFNVGDLVVTQYVNVFSIVNEVAEIIINHDGIQQVLWSYEMINGNWGSEGGTDIIFPLTDFAGEDIQVEFRSHGNSTYNINWWSIFNVAVTALFDNDMVALGVEGPTNLQPGTSGSWTASVRNGGLLEQTEYTVELCKYGGDVVSSIQVYEPLQPGETADFDFDWMPVDQENTGIYCTVQLAADEYNDNNISDCSYLRVAEPQNYEVLVWDNDNESDYYHPETGAYLGTEMGIKEALDKNGISYTSTTYLPEDLTTYDAIFIALGIYCVG
jgi:hypothetical protein